jgi:hypothetical protein
MFIVSLLTLDFRGWWVATENVTFDDSVEFVMCCYLEYKLRNEQVVINFNIIQP